MSPKDQTSDQNPQKETTAQTNTTSSASVGQAIDTIAFGSQTEQTSAGSDSQSLRSTRSQLQSQLNPNPRPMKNNIFGLEMPFDLISVAFASTVAVGGIIGYVKAKSTMSLVAGLVFGGILGFGAYQTSVNPRNYYLTLGTSAALGALMGYRAINSGKFMPAGLIATLSGLMVIRFAVRYFTDTNYLKK